MKSKKIGILNYYYSNQNYGAVLQAYAIQEYLISLGYNAQTINFRNFPRRPDRALNTAIQSFILSNPFERFRRKWLKLSKSIYFWAFQLNAAKRDFDIFLVGSDQVWRASFGKSKAHFPSTVYYLSFVPNGKKRIAYGVSFGTDHWDVGINTSFTELAKKEIKKFNSISVRESSGITICKDIFGVESTQVLDPTLLVGRYYFEKIIGIDNKTSLGGIVYYKLDADTEFNNIISYLSHELKTVSKNIYYSSVKTVFNETLFSYYEVSDWLREIRDAEIIVTDSYHCICFCILFEKKFIYYPNKVRGVARLESLLGLLGLTDRMYVSSEDIKNRSNWRQPVNYLKVNNLLEIERRKSEIFLKNALN